MEMPDLLTEMQQCKSVKACIALALTDAYGDDEQASAWLACIETMFDRFDRVKSHGRGSNPSRLRPQQHVGRGNLRKGETPRPSRLGGR